MKCTQQTINKAIRTFIQTAIGYAAGIAAVMNLEEKNNDI